MPRCLCCGEKFQKKYPTQIGKLRYCLLKDECIKAFYQAVEDRKKRNEQKEWNTKKKELKEKLKTRTDHLNELQKIFNTYIRTRDKDKECVSCGASLKSKKVDASHYRSVGNCPALRFNEDNVHSACVYCNRHLHGNLIEYRIRLVKRIGIEKVEWLEQEHEPQKYTLDEILELKKFYKKKIAELKDNV